MTNPLTDEVIDKAVELLPCPFCNGEAVAVEQEDEDGRFAAVGCLKCGAGSRQHYFCGDDARVHVISAWNTRAAAKVIESALAGDQRDAERYRWLRDLVNRSPGKRNITIGFNDSDSYCLWNEELDTAIDASIKGKSHE